MAIDLFYYILIYYSVSQYYADLFYFTWLDISDIIY